MALSSPLPGVVEAKLWACAVVPAKTSNTSIIENLRKHLMYNCNIFQLNGWQWPAFNSAMWIVEFLNMPAGRLSENNHFLYNFLAQFFVKQFLYFFAAVAKFLFQGG